MSLPSSFREFVQTVSAWKNETTDPDAGGGTARGLGSVWWRNGSYPTTPTELYTKSNASSQGWAKQNLVNLRIFNITLAPYSAVGDGVTSCNAAINAAITDAAAAGGGVIYFPAAVLGYAVYHAVGPQSLFEISNKSNLLFLGDGYNSWIKMTGDFALASQFLFRIFNQSKRIQFHNLRMNGATITNPSAADQNHFIQVSSAAPDGGPPSDVDIVGCWFDPIVGTSLRVLGESGLVPSNIRYIRNAVNMGVTSRSGLEAQRYSHKVMVHDNWMGPIKNSQIDFEPTVGGGVTDGGPTAWSVCGNIIDFGSRPTIAVSLDGGGTSQTLRNIFAFNTIVNGGNINCILINNTDIVGNIVTVNGTQTQSVFYCQSTASAVLVQANLFISETIAEERAAINVLGDVNGNSTGFVIADNICKQRSGITAAVAPMELTTCNQFVVNGNMLFSEAGLANTYYGILMRATLAVGDNWEMVGNLVVSTNLIFKAGISINTGGNFDVTNTLLAGNLVELATTAFAFETSAGKVFLGWRGVVRNIGANVTAAVIGFPTTNVGVTIEGTAGANAQIAATTVAAGPNTFVTAPPGSLCPNSAGTGATLPTILSYKETGTGNTGWFAVGPSQLEWGVILSSVATAARFIAPGYELAVEGTAEIKLPVPRPMSIRGMRVACTAGVGVATITYTLRKNGANTTVAIAMANTATTATVTSASTWVAGDLMSLQITKGAIPGTPQSNIVVTLDPSG